MFINLSNPSGMTLMLRMSKWLTRFLLSQQARCQNCEANVGVNVPGFPESLFHTDTAPRELLCILRLQAYTGIRSLLLLFLPAKPEAAG